MATDRIVCGTALLVVINEVCDPVGSARLEA